MDEIIFNNLISIVGTFSVILTLVFAILTYFISKNSQKIDLKTDEIPPWELTKISEDRWVLKRTQSKISTLYGHSVDNHNSVNINYESASGLPPRSFSKGTYTTFRINGILGGNITFYYREHKDADLINNKESYHGTISNRQVQPDGIKSWTTPLY